jgi:hypothetical protein
MVKVDGITVSQNIRQMQFKNQEQKNAKPKNLSLRLSEALEMCI